MTSSVNGLEFFLGSLIPVILLMMVINVLCVLISGFSMNGIEWLCYMMITTISSTIGAIIGMIFGIFAKNQMSAGTMTTPLLMLLIDVYKRQCFYCITCNWYFIEYKNK